MQAIQRTASISTQAPPTTCRMQHAPCRAHKRHPGCSVHKMEPLYMPAGRPGPADVRLQRRDVLRPVPASYNPQNTDAPLVQPSPSLTAEEAVRVQLDAVQNNDTPWRAPSQPTSPLLSIQQYHSVFVFTTTAFQAVSTSMSFLTLAALPTNIFSVSLSPDTPTHTPHLLLTRNGPGPTMASKLCTILATISGGWNLACTLAFGKICTI
jgi:hypothetical protein